MDEAAVLKQLFFNTIRAINSRDYSAEQVAAWAPDDVCDQRWMDKIASIKPVVAVIGETIVGYTDLQPDGYIDHFYTHHAWQGHGVGTCMLNYLKNLATQLGINRLYSHVSITARPFFEKHGFELVRQRRLETRGQSLINYELACFLGDISYLRSKPRN